MGDRNIGKGENSQADSHVDEGEVSQGKGGIREDDTGGHSLLSSHP